MSPSVRLEDPAPAKEPAAESRADSQTSRAGIETRTGARADLAREDELPVVARMVVEIRSDGLRTVARGALEDVATGQRVAVQARGTTPLALAASLARSMFSAPVLAGQALRALVARKR